MQSLLRLVVVCALALGPTAAALAETATYRLTVVNTWSEVTHPGLFPPDAHFSWIGGATHTAAVTFWEEGMLATPGIKQMAEDGATFFLVDEVEAAITAGTAGSVLNWEHWFCPDGIDNAACGPMVVEFEVDDAFPLVTLTTMLGPSPDWFVGVTGLVLHDGSSFVDQVVIDLRPYDGGTRDQNLLQLGGPLTTPPEPISLITAGTGQLIGPDSLGTFIIERVTPSVPLLGPAVWLLAAVLGVLGAVRLRMRG